MTIQARVHEAMHPGMTLVTTYPFAHTYTRSARDFVVMGADAG